MILSDHASYYGPDMTIFDIYLDNKNLFNLRFENQISKDFSINLFNLRFENQISKDFSIKYLFNIYVI